MDPRTDARVPIALYRQMWDWMMLHDPDMPSLIEWSNEHREFPASAQKVASEVIWIILCAGRSAQAARTIEAKVWKALREDRPVVEVFGYRAKAEAIERAWRERERDFAGLLKARDDGIDGVLSWCRSIPFVGDDTQFQLAKNFGFDLCKPDIWLCRLAGLADKPRRRVGLRFKACMDLCEPLARACGQRVATVDSALWLACNKGVLAVDADAGPVRFSPRSQGYRGSIFS